MDYINIQLLQGTEQYMGQDDYIIDGIIEQIELDYYSDQGFPVM